MELRRFGNTGLEVPAVGMGTWQTFDVRGGAAAESRRQVVDAAVECGATFFDSSPMYGQAERVLAKTLEGRRGSAIVATKVWASDDQEAERQVVTALRYFGGYVGVYQIHNLLAVGARLAQLERVKERGGTGVIGVTHYSPRAFDDLRRVMDDRRVGAIQIPYNPRERDVEAAILPAAADRGLGVIVMRPLGQGDLARRRVSKEALAPLRPFGVTSWPQALLKWILSDARCHVAIPATANPAHMRANAAAGDPPWFGPEERAYVAKLATGGEA
jgi:aryl-alcohol dehydrogenase-like predicted oxidoreductase